MDAAKRTFYDGTRKANLDVEIAVDMLSLAGRYETAVLVSGDEDFVYAVNAVAYKGCRVEVAGFRSNTAPRLIDVADFFIDLGEIADLIRKDHTQADEYEIPTFVPPGEIVTTHPRNLQGDVFGGAGNPVPFDNELARDDEDEVADFDRISDER